MTIKRLGKVFGCLQDWMIPLVEVLMTLPILLSLIVNSSPFLYIGNFYICSLGEFMKMEVNRLEKLLASVDYSKAEGKDLQEEEQQEIAKKIREEYLADYSMEQIKEDIIKTRKYEASKRTLYMLK